MKKVRFIITAAFFILFAGSVNNSCDLLDDCDGMGTLSLENRSTGTVQKIMIDGVNYGSLDPDESRDIELAPGSHTWQLVGISGGTGCSAATVIIVECKTSSYYCDAK